MLSRSLQILPRVANTSRGLVNQSVRFYSEGSDPFGLPWDVYTPKPQKVKVESEGLDPNKSELILKPLPKRSSKKLKRNLRPLEMDYFALLHNPDTGDVNKTIESMKPETEISVNQASELLEQLKRMFKKKQLSDYLKNISGISKAHSTKKEIIAEILRNWKVNISEGANSKVDEVKATLDMTNKRDLFLLMSSNGKLLQHWGLMGVELQMNPVTRELIIFGSKEIVGFVVASWNSILDDLIVKKVHLLNEFEKFCDKIGDTENAERQWKEMLKALQNETGGYFDVINSEEKVYIISSMNNYSWKKIKREFTKMINSTTGIENSQLIGYDIDISDPSLPWYIRFQGAKSKLAEKERLSESPLVDETQLVSQLVDQVKLLKEDVSSAQEQQELTFITQPQDLEEAHLNIENHFNVEIPSIDLENIKDKLKSPVKPSNTAEKIILPSTISAQIGHLFKPLYFNPSIPALPYLLSQLPLVNPTSILSSTGGIKNNFSRHIQLKLYPDIFSTEKTDVNPIDIIIPVTSDGILFTHEDQRAWNAYYTEYEHHIPVSMGEFDVRFTISTNSKLVFNMNDWIENGGSGKEFLDIFAIKTNGDKTENEIEIENDPNEGTASESITKNKSISQLNKNSIYSRLNLVDRMKLDSSEDLTKFIRKLQTLSFPLHINGENPVYNVIDAKLVKSLELDCGSPVIYEVKDNGEEITWEVSMIGDNLENVKKFVTYLSGR